jgi:hypothetical protein
MNKIEAVILVGFSFLIMNHCPLVVQTNLSPGMPSLSIAAVFSVLLAHLTLLFYTNVCHCIH